MLFEYISKVLDILFRDWLGFPLIIVLGQALNIFAYNWPSVVVASKTVERNRTP